jgi:TPR repeat protein
LKYFEKSLAWSKQEAVQGNPEAQLALGKHFWFGYGVREDRATAVRWFHSAMQQGDREGTYLLGRAYYTGDGVPEQDQPKGLEMVKTAAGQGSSDALEWLGTLFATGDSRLFSRTAAGFILRAFGKDGVAVFHSFAQKYEEGLSGVPRSEPMALYWYEQAAKFGHVPSMRKVAHCYENGKLGASKDVTIAKKLKAGDSKCLKVRDCPFGL